MQKRPTDVLGRRRVSSGSLELYDGVRGSAFQFHRTPDSLHALVRQESLPFRIGGARSIQLRVFHRQHDLRNHRRNEYERRLRLL